MNNRIILNQQIMEMALGSLKNRWFIAVIIGIIESLFLCGVNIVPILGKFSWFIFYGPVRSGISLCYLKFSKGDDVKISHMFYAFKNFNKFKAGCIAGILMIIFTILWTVLLIIPGIIAWISYAMTFYIIADNESSSGYEALKRSQKMMYGYKYAYFCLLCRFIGWALLSILTFGIGFLLLVPYTRASSAKFYEKLKANHI